MHGNLRKKPHCYCWWSGLPAPFQPSKRCVVTSPHSSSSLSLSIERRLATWKWNLQPCWCSARDAGRPHWPSGALASLIQSNMQLASSLWQFLPPPHPPKEQTSFALKGSSEFWLFLLVFRDHENGRGRWQKVAAPWASWLVNVLSAF